MAGSVVEAMVEEETVDFDIPNSKDDSIEFEFENTFGLDEEQGSPAAAAAAGEAIEGKDFVQQKAYIPGMDELDAGDTLEYESSAYNMYHALTVEWPCLSFDVLRDNLGSGRTRVCSATVFVRFVCASRICSVPIDHAYGCWFSSRSSRK